MRGACSPTPAVFALALAAALAAGPGRAWGSVPPAETDPVPPCGLAGRGPSGVISLLGGLGRPVVDGVALTFDTAVAPVRVHYALEGADALAGPEDVDPPDGVPDQLASIAGGVDRVWQQYVGIDGWRGVPEDGDRGGDGRIDLYVVQIDARGYAVPEAVADGWTSYLMVDPDATWGLGAETQASVAGHELHHALQFAYSVQAGPFMYEGTATYAQYLGFDSSELSGALELLWALRLVDPDRSVDDQGAEFEYAALVWVKYLVDRAGDREVVRRLWEALEAEGGDWRRAHARLGEGEGMRARDILSEHAEWNLFACGRDDGAHYAEDPARCEMGTQVEIAARTDSLPWDGVVGDEGIEPWAYAYLEITAPGDGGAVRFTCASEPGADLRLRAVAVGPDGSSAGSSEAEVEADEASGAVDSPVVPGGGQAVLAVLAFGEDRVTVTCGAEREGTVTAPGPPAADETESCQSGCRHASAPADLGGACCAASMVLWGLARRRSFSSARRRSTDGGGARREPPSPRACGRTWRPPHGVPGWIAGGTRSPHEWRRATDIGRSGRRRGRGG